MLYVGTYTHLAGSVGIHSFAVDSWSGELTGRGSTPASDPWWITTTPDRRYLIGVNRWIDAHSKEGGAVSTFYIDKDSGGLRLIDISPAGSDPCHACVDPSGQYVLVATHGDGKIIVFGLGNDGRLVGPTHIVQHSDVVRNSQLPRTHFVGFDPSGEFLIVCDKGLDQVFMYSLDRNVGRLTRGQEVVSLRPGAGPRHAVFHPNGQFLYVNNEQHSTVATLRSDERGGFELIQNESTLPGMYRGKNTSSEIDIHPSGMFLYVSNRGHDSICVFEISQEEGSLRRVAWESTGGRRPRSFAIDTAARFLYVGNQDSDCIKSFEIDAKTGRLSPVQIANATVEVPTPVCLSWVDIP